VQRVGAHRGRAGQANHLALQGQQSDGQRQRQQHHADADGCVTQRLRGLQALIGLYPDQYRTDPDEQRLGHARQRLCLTVAKAMVVIGRAQGVVHGKQVEERGDGVQRRVGQPGQQADRAAQPPGHSLAYHQYAGHRQ